VLAAVVNTGRQCAVDGSAAAVLSLRSTSFLSSTHDRLDHGASKHLEWTSVGRWDTATVYPDRVVERRVQ